MSTTKRWFALLAILFITCESFAEQPVFVKEFLGQIDFVKGRIMQLADAMPEETYGWTPGEGVRSVGEVYVHIAQSNYYMLSLLKGEKPDMTQSKNETDKKTALAMMEKSFEVIKETTSGFSEEDLNKEIDAFGMKFSVRNFMVTMIGHLHEHLGQSIAYARMNGVTPPWSAQE
ncbi:MAG: DinB family protein [Ignavibacteriaceae bacterium]|nr:DinB family protein [Ignavibacteriaceae bacterium]